MISREIGITMDRDNKTMRLVCVILFILMAVLSVIEFAIAPHISIWLAILMIGVAYSIWQSDYWGPRFGFWLSVVNIGYAIYEMIMRYEIFAVELWGWDAAYFNVPLIILAVVTSIICIKLLRVEKVKFREDLEHHKRYPHGRDGNCPKCGFDQIKFIDGVDYKCTRCGEIY